MTEIVDRDADHLSEYTISALSGRRRRRPLVRVTVALLTGLLVVFFALIGLVLTAHDSNPLASPHIPTSPQGPTPAQLSASPAVPMSPPPGYSAQQMIFDDRFLGTSLDPDNWVTYLGAQGQVWNNLANLPLPYSADNSVTNGGTGGDISMYSPSQVTVDNGLTLTAEPNTNSWSSSYPWISGIVSTEGKFTLPTGGWYVQVKAEMPDQTRGMWPAIWFLCGISCPEQNELDAYEGGFLLGGTKTNEVMHSNYFPAQGEQASSFDVHTDTSASYHVYGIQFIPGQSITAYLDGSQVWRVNASAGVTIPGEPYEILLELQVAGNPTSQWHTVPTAATPSSSMKVAEVQAYSYPPAAPTHEFFGG